MYSSCESTCTFCRLFADALCHPDPEATCTVVQESVAARARIKDSNSRLISLVNTIVLDPMQNESLLLSEHLS